MFSKSKIKRSTLHLILETEPCFSNLFNMLGVKGIFPLDIKSHSGNVLGLSTYFPSAISIKRNSLETLLPMYPELETTAEFHFKRLNKIVRFLPPKTNQPNYNLPCNDLVFIKYEKGSDLQFNKISKIEAFQQLIPDSWISDKVKNVEVFLQWFANTNCYKLKYSNNDKMIKTIKNLLNNDL